MWPARYTTGHLVMSAPQSKKCSLFLAFSFLTVPHGIRYVYTVLDLQAFVVACVSVAAAVVVYLLQACC